MKKKTIMALLTTIIIATISGSCSSKRDAENCNNKINKELEMLETSGSKVIWIQDNEGSHMMKTELFADAPKGLLDSLNLQNGISASMSTFLVECDSVRILFDTGLGSPNSRLVKVLKENGISPEDIQYIYLTHFHGDHIGGMMREDSVVFPNAQVYASRSEYEAWMNMPADKNAQVVKTMNAYKKNIHLFEFGDTLPRRVLTIDAVGHTPGHTAFQAGKLLVIGDLVHGAALQLEHPEICASYDMDKETAIKTRIRILQYAKDNGLTMAGMHLPAPGFK